jgi:hypothetical protein
MTREALGDVIMYVTPTTSSSVSRTGLMPEDSGMREQSDRASLSPHLDKMPPIEFGRFAADRRDVC